MTIIVADHEKMLSDSKVTVGSSSYLTPKIIRKGNALIGTASNVASGNKFIRWFGTKQKRPTKEEIGDDDFTALVLTPEGLFWYDNEFEGFPITDGVAALGSDQATGGALAAIRCFGATLERAVEVACAVDSNCGLPVQVETLSIKTKTTATTAPSQTAPARELKSRKRVQTS